jgi:eukaryotic-like serine/threonine-protein kinase
MFPIRGTIGGYELISVLGRSSGTGAVYLAADHGSGHMVALKVRYPHAAQTAADLIAAEREGARLQQQLALRTPAVPAVYGSGFADGLFYVAMEYVDGEDLDERIGDGRCLAPADAAAIARDLCACLAIAHTPRLIDGAPRWIVHGDLKPGNIRLTATGELKLLDFGTARLVTAAKPYADERYLTIQYASPERIATGRIDAAADLWAAGVLLYEALSGERPAVSPALPRSCPPALRRIACRATAREAWRRYGQAHEMLRDLECAVTEHRGVA